MEVNVELMFYLAVVIVFLLGVLGWLAYLNGIFHVPDGKELQRRKSAKKRQQQEQEQAEKDERLNELEDQHEQMKAEVKQLTKQLKSVQQRHKKQLEVNRKQEDVLTEKDMQLQELKDQQDEEMKTARAKLKLANKRLDLANQRIDKLTGEKDAQLQCLNDIIEAGETNQKKLQREVIVKAQENEQLSNDNVREKLLRKGVEKRISEIIRDQPLIEQRHEQDLETVHDSLCRERRQKTEARRQKTEANDEVEQLQRKCDTLQMSLKQSQRDLEDSQLCIARHKRSRREEDLLDVIAFRRPAHYAHEEKDTHRRCGPHCDPWIPYRYDAGPIPTWVCHHINDPGRHFSQEDANERKQREAQQQEEIDEQVRKMKQKHGVDLENMEAKIKKANQVIADVERENGLLRKERVTLKQDLDKNRHDIEELQRKSREDKESVALRYYQQSRNDQGVNQTRQTASLEAEDNHDNDPSVDEPLTGSVARNGANSTGEQLDDERVESQALALPVLPALPSDIAFSHQEGGVNNDDDVTPTQDLADVDMQTPVPAQDSADVDMQIPDSVPVPQMPSMRSRSHSLHRSISWPPCELDGVEPRSRTASCSINGSIPSCNLESLESALISEDGH